MSTPIVLVPGLYCTARVYSAQIPALWNHGPVTIADHTREDDVDAIAAQILSTAPARLALAGVSMGGYVALAIQRAAPERIERLALLSTAATPDDERQKDVRRRGQALEREGRFEDILQAGWPLLAHPDHQDDEALKDVMREMHDAIGLDASIRQLQAVMDRPDARPQLGSIDVPTLVLVGDEDRTTPPERAREMADAIPDARLVVVPRAGHLVLLEQPDATTRALADWLR